MTQEEQLQNNRLIAEFRGAKFMDCGGGIHIAEVGRDFCPTGATSVDLWGLKYHTSWNWLMPVVEKIDQILPDDSFVLIEYNRCIIPVLEAEEPFDIDFVCNTRLEATYRAAVEFIRWHSEEKAKEGAR